MFDGLGLPTARGASSRLELDTLDPINRGQVGFWPLNEGGGKVARDLSQYRRNGIRGPVTPKPGPFGRGILTSGAAGSYVSVPTITIPASTPLTVTWAGMYPSATPTDVAFGAGTGVSASPRMMILWPYSNTVYWDYGNDGSGRISASGSAFANKWCVWSFVNNGVNRKEIWCNGVRLNSSASTAALGTSFAGLWFGAGPAGNYPNSAASMAAARIHFRALQVGELVRLGRDPWAGTVNPAARLFFGPVRVSGATSITGSGAATLGALTGTGAGTLSITGTGAATLGAATAAGVGALAIVGTGAGTLGTLASTAAGTLAITAAGAATLGAVTAAGAGTLSITGAAAQTLGTLTGAAAATLSITGSGAVTLGALTGEASSSDQSTGTGAVTLGALTGAGVGTLAITGAGAATLGAVAGAGVGVLSIVGAGAGELGLLTGSGVGVLPITGTLAATLGALTMVGTDAARVPAPASRTYTWPVETRAVTWHAENRAATWPAQSRTVTWRG